MNKDRKTARGLDIKSTKRLSAATYLSLIVRQTQLKLLTSLSENFAALRERGFRDTWWLSPSTSPALSTRLKIRCAHMPPASACAVSLALNVSRAPLLSNEHPLIPFNLTSLGRTPWTDQSKLIFHFPVFSWIPYIDFLRLLFSKCLHYPRTECFELVCLTSLAISRRHSDGMTWSLPWEKIEFSGRDRPVSNYDKLECDKHWDGRQQHLACNWERTGSLGKQCHKWNLNA